MSFSPLAHRRQFVRRVIGTEPEDFDGDALHLIANGPICDALGHFCPAGRLSWDDTKRREAAQVIA